MRVCYQNLLLVWEMFHKHHLVIKKGVDKLIGVYLGKKREIVNTAKIIKNKINTVQINTACATKRFLQKN